jgi:hypothetical protein
VKLLGAVKPVSKNSIFMTGDVNGIKRNAFFGAEISFRLDIKNKTICFRSAKIETILK